MFPLLGGVSSGRTEMVRSGRGTLRDSEACAHYGEIGSGSRNRLSAKHERRGGAKRYRDGDSEEP